MTVSLEAYLEAIETIELHMINIDVVKPCRGQRGYSGYNGPAGPPRYHTLAEYKHEVSASALAFCPVSESPGPAPPSVRCPTPSNAARKAVGAYAAIQQKRFRCCERRFRNNLRTGKRLILNINFRCGDFVGQLFGDYEETASLHLGRIDRRILYSSKRQNTPPVWCQVGKRPRTLQLRARRRHVGGQLPTCMTLRPGDRSRQRGLTPS
ncbi:hypothetical protein EVAR_49024_1 [Eumeta japonica]|uniref:Uncharacterized protein n=1 Tax=Eumeta variegata TaxID=151549 RepID=A0A4C1XRN2_EUMVA|nr:hypothetical protein EVAR_49024_1 [Eumeta japonica]